jgi:hypothetical protein
LSNVAVHGPIAKEDTRAFYNACDLCLVPLADVPVFQETVPSKIFEIMACERPVLASLAGEAARIVAESGAGTVVPPADPEAIAAGVVRMLQLPAEERRVMGRRGRRYVASHYDRQVLADRYSGAPQGRRRQDGSFPQGGGGRGMRILVTGASGFVGRAVLERASDAVQLRAVVRSGPATAGVETVRIGDIADDVDWRPHLQGVDAVVHLAARVHVMRDSASDPSRGLPPGQRGRNATARRSRRGCRCAPFRLREHRQGSWGRERGAIRSHRKARSGPWIRTA